MYRSAHQDEIARYEEAVQFLKRNSTDGTIPTMKNLRNSKFDGREKSIKGQPWDFGKVLWLALFMPFLEGWFVTTLGLGTAALLCMFRFKDHINIPASGLQFVKGQIEFFSNLCEKKHFVVKRRTAFTFYKQ